MREIKFRAWDDVKKEWLLGYEMLHLGGFSLYGEMMLMGEWSQILDQFIFERNGHKQDDLKVMQYTGLKDKNGNEIYEGDVLSLWSYKDDVDCHWKVCFEQGAFCGKQVAGGIDYLRNMTEYQVIGNIYENPELLQ